MQHGRAGQFRRSNEHEPPSNLGNLTYAYDADGRRTVVGGALAAVHLPSNVAGSGTTYNADNEQIKFNGTSLTYDAAGQLTGDGTNTYTWDARHQLTKISQGSTTIATFVNDAFGRRMSKTISSSVTQFLYDGLNPVQELNGGNPPSLTANLLTGLGIDEFFARTASGATSTLLADALGSTIGLVGIGRHDRDQLYLSAVRRGHDRRSGQHQPLPVHRPRKRRHRVLLLPCPLLQPDVSEIHRQDPIGFAGGVNSYAYVGDDP